MKRMFGPNRKEETEGGQNCIKNSFLIRDIQQILMIEENKMARASSGKKEYRKCEIHSNAKEDLYAT